MLVHKILISSPQEPIGDMKWPIDMLHFGDIVTGQRPPMTAEMAEVFSCPIAGLYCAAVWNPTTESWVSDANPSDVGVLFEAYKKETGRW